jgi:tetratricopeptide (TPR) repeat protein
MTKRKSNVIPHLFWGNGKTPTPKDTPATVHVLRPRPSDANVQKAYECFRRADTLDGDPATYAAAEGLYRKAIALDPLLSAAYANLGALRLKRRAPIGEAIHWNRRAVELDPLGSVGHYNLGFLLLTSRKPLEAIEYLKKAVELDPGFADAHFNLALALEQTKQDGTKHWEAYLFFNPSGEHVKQARWHLLPKNTRK